MYFWLYFIRPNLKGRKKMGFFKWTLVTLSLRFLFLQKTFLCTKLPCASIHSNYFCQIHTTIVQEVLAYTLNCHIILVWHDFQLTWFCPATKNMLGEELLYFYQICICTSTGGPCIMYYLNYQNVWNNKLPKI